ncbi:glycosyltransferase [Desulforhopalus sp. IMCC35007]|uniref:glycosyltransferase n=1 Tax=Desulforhopalus sp. IMCC35007 TaxID=2569543 RepID=UPI0010AE3B0E|nr:glycosyltransferase [Desulforhopalus sp. IMCC35007]TKB05995.1 glycosyltransferase [Desulforhopalus sp. IMCC35007]
MTFQKKRSVLILADGMSAGGTERQIIELLKGFQYNKNFEIIFGVLVKDGECVPEAGYYAAKILPVRQSSQYDFTLAWSLIHLTREYNIDLIHTFGSVSDFSGIVAGRINNIPVVNGSIRNARPKLNKRDKISRFCMRFATGIVANSYAGIRAYGMENRDNAQVIYNGVDIKRFEDIIPAQIPEQSICMVGNFSLKKDQAQLIKILPKLLEKYSRLHLILVGRGDNLDNLQQQVAFLGLTQSVTFVTDCNSPESIVSGCEIGVLLSPEGEGFSNAIIEYMALGKPVIASALGGNHELVDHGKTGYLVENGKAEQLITYISHLLSEPYAAKKMGEAGKEKIAEHFHVSRMVNSYEDLYFRLTEDSL